MENSLQIFLSHQTNDKSVVSKYAGRLAEKFGAAQIKYDDWSIAPGQSIIQFMDDGVSAATHFILFWSGNAANSAAVNQEWQAALMRYFSSSIKFLVLRLDDEPIPSILAHMKYLNHAHGLDKCCGQISEFLLGRYDKEIVEAFDVYCDIEHRKVDDSLLFRLNSVSEKPEIGPFMLGSNVHFDNFSFTTENSRDFEELVTDDASQGGSSRFAIGFRFKDGGVSSNRPALMRLNQKKPSGPILSYLHLKKNNRWIKIPINRVEGFH